MSNMSLSFIRSKVMKLTFEQHLKNMHEVLQAAHTLYPEKNVKNAKMEKSKNTAN